MPYFVLDNESIDSLFSVLPGLGMVRQSPKLINLGYDPASILNAVDCLY